MALVSLSSAAKSTDHMVRDTVYFYENWEQMLNVDPSAMLVSPVIEAVNPFEIDIYTTSDDYSLSGYQAASLGDSIWLVSGKYLRTNFKGDARDFSSSYFYPVFFNKKTAYLVSSGYDEENSLKTLLFGTTDDGQPVAVFYYLDFMNGKVLKVTPKVLSQLLEDYHDLQMRYEGMKSRKKHEIIEDYFYKFIDRYTQDLMTPCILDLTY